VQIKKKERDFHSFIFIALKNAGGLIALKNAGRLI